MLNPPPDSELCAGGCRIPGGEFILGGNYLLLMCGLSLWVMKAARLSEEVQITFQCFVLKQWH